WRCCTGRVGNGWNYSDGRRLTPASTVLRASSAAPTITDGLEVLVHEVMAAITTEPWSTAVLVPSSRVTWAGWDGRPGFSLLTGSEAGDVPARPVSRPGACT